MKGKKKNDDVSISNSLLVNSVNILIVCDSYFFFFSSHFFFSLFRPYVYPRPFRRSMKIMLMLWETATSAFVKKKTTMKLSQSYFHPTVHVICILGTANKKLNSRYCFFFFSFIYSIYQINVKKEQIKR